MDNVLMRVDTSKVQWSLSFRILTIDIYLLTGKKDPYDRDRPFESR